MTEQNVGVAMALVPQRQRVYYTPHARQEELFQLLHIIFVSKALVYSEKIIIIRELKCEGTLSAVG
jgi:hypothetical protein